MYGCKYGKLCDIVKVVVHNVRPAGHIRPAMGRQVARDVHQESDYIRYVTDIILAVAYTNNFTTPG